ncbi:MAG: hypothetical protein UU98_C0043G0010 [Parcubacteria group bacterium GW2011_GWD2_42_14]|nr:MAG: hypothetical protein UU98_C0043G0010 [Parcubacteria group bacterium GW2011_GWD2_42_14]
MLFCFLESQLLLRSFILQGELPMKELAFSLNVIGAVLGSLAGCIYGIRIFLGKEKANLATWSIVLLLDSAGLYLTYVTGNDEPYIQIGWCFTAALIFVGAWVRKGDWVWTRTETAVLVLCIVSVVLWLTSEAVLVSLFGYLAAAYLSALPQAKDYLRHPEVARKSAWVWQISVVAILFPLAAKLVEEKYGIGDTLIYYAFIVLNMSLAVLCMRRTA